jgi:hypothetical protein
MPLKIKKVLSSSTLGLKASPCCIPSCPITTCILITLYLLFDCINVMGPMLRCDQCCLPCALINRVLSLCWVVLLEQTLGWVV